MKPDLQQRLQAAFPALADDHFAYHGTDLYVVALPGGLAWLNENYAHFNNITAFTSQVGSNWVGAGTRCLDVPFAGNWPKVVR